MLSIGTQKSDRIYDEHIRQLVEKTSFLKIDIKDKICRLI